MGKLADEVNAFSQYLSDNSQKIAEEHYCSVREQGVQHAPVIHYPRACPALARHAGVYRRLLKPARAAGRALTRIGAVYDGGYLMYEPESGGVAYSLGIGDEVAWDLAMAELGFDIFQYDGSVDAPPVAHPRFHFHKSFIGTSRTSADGTALLPEILEANGHLGRTDLVLQIDIEGAEWGVFAEISDRHLCQFTQIIAELHLPVDNLALLPACGSILRRLNKNHQVVHAHVNNSSATLYLEEEVFWPVVEVTWLRRDGHIFEPSTSCYPLELDNPCIPSMREIQSGYWGLLS